jgi:hypothetical protein
MFASVSVSMEEEIAAIAKMAPNFTVTHHICDALHSFPGFLYHRKLLSVSQEKL